MSPSSKNVQLYRDYLIHIEWKPEQLFGTNWLQLDHRYLKVSCNLYFWGANRGRKPKLLVIGLWSYVSERRSFLLLGISSNSRDRNRNPTYITYRQMIYIYVITNWRHRSNNKLNTLSQHQTDDTVPRYFTLVQSFMKWILISKLLICLFSKGIQHQHKNENFERIKSTDTNS